MILGATLIHLIPLLNQPEMIFRPIEEGYYIIVRSYTCRCFCSAPLLFVASSLFSRRYQYSRFHTTGNQQQFLNTASFDSVKSRQRSFLQQQYRQENSSCDAITLPRLRYIFQLFRCSNIICIKENIFI